MFDIGFVVLNYNLYREVIQCVSSIETSIDTPNYHVVIVDNASPNKIGERIADHYAGNKHVSVVINDDNVGFARGNNTGIDFLRYKAGGAKYICCLNNDTILEQKNVYAILDKIYNSDHQIGVIGPRIYDRYYYEHKGMGNFLTGNGYKMLKEESLKTKRRPRYIVSTSPLRRRLLGINAIYDINYFRRSMEKHIKQRLFFQRNIDKYMRNISESGDLVSGCGGVYDVILHGCCLFFTPAFFCNLNGFDPKTFLYGEEAILYLDVVRDGLRTYKTDNIHIRHLEDVSTDSSIKKSEKSEFRLKNEINSLQILIEKIEMYDQTNCDSTGDFLV